MRPPAVLWYFSATARESCVDLSYARAREGRLDRIAVEAAHGQGTLEVYGVFSDRPCDRDAVRALFASNGDRRRDRVVVLKKRLEIR